MYICIFGKVVAAWSKEAPNNTQRDTPHSKSSPLESSNSGSNEIFCWQILPSSGRNFNFRDGNQYVLQSLVIDQSVKMTVELLVEILCPWSTRAVTI